MLTQLSLHSSIFGPPDGRQGLGSRASAALFRAHIESALAKGDEIEINFEGVEATQSFVDELVGVIVLERGPDVLQTVRFRRCSADMKSILRFVVSDRAKQYSLKLGVPSSNAS